MATAPDLDRFPAGLKAQPWWIAWRYKARKTGKPTKRPLQKTNQQAAWLSVSDACAFVARDEANGVGIVLRGGIVGIDIDGCIDDDGNVHEIARDLIALGTYTEKSPGGHGLHAYLWATIPRSRKISARNGVPGREIYDGREGSARYFTVTGERVGKASEILGGHEAQTVLDAFYAKWCSKEHESVDFADNVEGTAEPGAIDNDVLRLLFNETNGGKWRRIFDGDWSGCYPSQSEADLALCRKLYFYTRANAAQMNRILRLSGLMRSKWDENRGTQTYADTTIAKAIRLGGRVYALPCPKYNAGTQEGQYGKVHRSVLPTLAKMTKTDNLVYEALATFANRFTGECDPSATTISRLILTTREHVQTSIGSLAAAGLILVMPRPGRTSIIRLLAFVGVSKFDTSRERQSRKGLMQPNGIARSLDPRKRRLLRSL